MRCFRSAMTLWVALLLVVVACEKRQEQPQELTPPPDEPSREWVRFKPPVGEGSILFPARPIEEIPPPGTKIPANTRLFSLDRPGAVVFDFGVTTLEDEVPAGTGKIFLWGLRGSYKMPGVKVIKEEYKKVNDLDCHEATFVVPEGPHIRQRMTASGRGLYVARVRGSSLARVSDADADRFLDSVRVGDRP